MLFRNRTLINAFLIFEYGYKIIVNGRMRVVEECIIHLVAKKESRFVELLEGSIGDVS